jgi:hypothetical protein
VPPETPRLATRSVAFQASPGILEQTLRRRLEQEARKQRLALDMPFAGRPGVEIDDPDPSDGRRVERTILRALRRTLDERLEEAARSSSALAPFFRWIDRRDAGVPSWSTTDAAVPHLESAAALASTPAAAGPLETGPASGRVGDLSLRFRLDAHPRLVVGGRLGALTGRIEVPLLERELRLSLDRPVGAHGRASFRGGHAADRGSWADLALHFRF